MSREEMLQELRALSEKVERPVQVYLDYRNERRGEALRLALAELAGVSSHQEEGGA